MEQRGVLILADDLTGAVDTSACFSRYGTKATVSADGSADGLTETVCGAVNAATRERRPEEARQIFRALGQQIGWLPDRLIVKKTDMGLRGNHGAEIEGLVEGMGAEICYLVNALPAYRTFVQNGKQYVKGKILTESMYVQDPSRRPETACIAEILAKQTSLPMAEIGLDTVRSDALEAEITRQVQAGNRLLIFDCVEDADCRRILQAGSLLPHRSVWAGTLGLLDAVARAVLPEPEIRPLRIGERPRCLCFTTSGYAGVRQQIAVAAAEGLRQIELDLGACLRGQEAMEREIRAAADRCRAVPAGENLIVTPRVPEGITDPALPRKILLAMSLCAETVCGELPFDRLVIIGGETAAHILRVLQANRLRIDGQPEVGTALGYIAAGPYAGKSFAAKGGSVGTEAALLYMLRAEHP